MRTLGHRWVSSRRAVAVRPSSTFAAGKDVPLGPNLADLALVPGRVLGQDGHHVLVKRICRPVPARVFARPIVSSAPSRSIFDHRSAFTSPLLLPVERRIHRMGRVVIHAPARCVDAVAATPHATPQAAECMSNALAHTKQRGSPCKPPNRPHRDRCSSLYLAIRARKAARSSGSSPAGRMHHARRKGLAPTGGSTGLSSGTI